MTIVPVSFQLTAWIPAWWQGRVGGDDLADLMGPPMLPELRAAAPSTIAVSAFCPALGVGVLPGPKAVTEAAVAAGEAVILHAAPGATAHVLVPDDERWTFLEAGPSRPVSLDIAQADRELAQAVVAAEHDLRESGKSVAAAPRRASVRQLPPDAEGPQRALLTRAATLWTAVDAVPAEQRTDLLDDVLRCAAQAVLAAYAAAGQARAAAGRPAPAQRRYA